MVCTAGHEPGPPADPRLTQYWKYDLRGPARRRTRRPRRRGSRDRPPAPPSTAPRRLRSPCGCRCRASSCGRPARAGPRPRRRARDAVPECRHPETGDGIEIAVAVDVHQLAPLGTLHHDRPVARAYVAIWVNPVVPARAAFPVRSSCWWRPSVPSMVAVASKSTTLPVGRGPATTVSGRVPPPPDGRRPRAARPRRCGPSRPAGRTARRPERPSGRRQCVTLSVAAAASSRAGRSGRCSRRVPLEVVLVLGLGLPEGTGRRDLGDHLAGQSPEASTSTMVRRRRLLGVARVEDGRR